MNTKVRRVIPEIDSEILQIMQKFGVGYSAAMRIWYRQIKQPRLKWKNF